MCTQFPVMSVMMLQGNFYVNILSCNLRCAKKKRSAMQKSTTLLVIVESGQ